MEDLVPKIVLVWGAETNTKRKKANMDLDHFQEAKHQKRKLVGCCCGQTVYSFYRQNANLCSKAPFFKHYI